MRILQIIPLVVAVFILVHIGAGFAIHVPSGAIPAGITDPGY